MTELIVCTSLLLPLKWTLSFQNKEETMNLDDLKNKVTESLPLEKLGTLTEEATTKASELGEQANNVTENLQNEATNLTENL